MNEVIVTDEQTTKDGKLLAIVAHFWVIGTIAAWILNLKKGNEFTAFYVRQMIGFQLLGFLIEFVVGKISGTIAFVLGGLLLVFWVLSLIGAATGKLKLMPVVGEYFQKLFRSL